MSVPEPQGVAGLVTRVLVAAVDATVVALGSMGLYFGLAGLRLFWSPLQFRWPQPSVLVSTCTLVLVAIGYLTVAWATTGRSYGATLLGVRVLARSRRRLGWMRALLRAVICVGVPVGLLWSAISPARRSWQDILVGSVVVYDRYRDGGEHAMTPDPLGGAAARALPPA
ncbi:MAG TPA: RDD family protein [Pseudonocardia sp.]